MATSKIAAERNQKALLELVSQPGNDVCADCKARAPRWASHNLGIFICVQCASVHRKLGTHISKVKSLTLDSWTKEQVQTMKENGNVKSNNFYNPDETRHPPPTNHLEAERDSETEKYIRAKYQYKKFVNKSAFVEMHLGPSRSVSSQLPLASSSSSAAPSSSSSATSVVPPVRPATAAATISGPSTVPPPPPIQNRSASLQVPVAGVNPQQPQYGILNQSNNPLRPSPLSGHTPMRSASQPLPRLQSAATATASSSLSAFPQPPSKDPVWNDLISLQTPSQNPSLPLQMTSQPMAIPSSTALGGLTPHNPFAMQLSHSPGQTVVPQGTGLPSAFGSSPGAIGGGLGGMSGITGGFGTGTSTGLVGLGVTAGGVGGSNPFQHHLQQPQMTIPSSSATSPFNPFTGMAMNNNSMSPPQQSFGQVAVQPHSQPFGVAAPTQPQIQTPQPQFLLAQGHSPQPTMFTQTPPPFGMGAVGAVATPPTATFGSTPSPMPFQQQQQIAPMPTGNPFVSWTPQGQQQQQQQQQQQPLGAMGYGMSPGQMPQQHWGGM